MVLKLDTTDRKILEILQTNAKITNAQLAKEIGLSPAPTLERVRKLELSGLIQSYHAQLDPEKMGLGVGIFIQASLATQKKHLIDTLMEKIQRIPEIVECYHITGSGDFLLKVLTHDIRSYQELILERLLELEEIEGLQSMVILNTYKRSPTLPFSGLDREAKVN